MAAATVDGVCELLHKWGLGKYESAFREAEVNGALLVTLTDDDLKEELGMSIKLHRKKLLQKL